MHIISFKNIQLYIVLNNKCLPINLGKCKKLNKWSSRNSAPSLHRYLLNIFWATIATASMGWVELWGHAHAFLCLLLHSVKQRDHTARNYSIGIPAQFQLVFCCSTLRQPLWCSCTLLSSHWRPPVVFAMPKMYHITPFYWLLDPTQSHSCKEGNRRGDSFCNNMACVFFGYWSIN